MIPRRIAIIGGTGPQGRGLALRLALAGHVVRLGSRQGPKGTQAAEGLNTLLDSIPPVGEAPRTAVWGGENRETLAGAELVLLTVPFEDAAATLTDLTPDIPPEAVFVDVTVPLDFSGKEVQLTVPPEGSGSRHLRKILPSSIPFCAAGKTLPAHVLEDPAVSLDCHCFVFGDDKQAKTLVMEALDAIPGLECLDVGGLGAAAHVEGMTALLIRINRRRRSRQGRFRVVGI